MHTIRAWQYADVGEVPLTSVLALACALKIPADQVEWFAWTAIA